jgi:hypothetical protein
MKQYRRLIGRLLFLWRITICFLAGNLAITGCQMFKLQPGVLALKTLTASPGVCGSVTCTPTVALSPSPMASPSSSPVLAVTTPAGTLVPAPSPTPRWGTCQDNMAFVLRLDEMGEVLQNVPLMDPGVPFRFGWRVRNTGSCTWDSSYTLVYVGSGQPGASLVGNPATIVGRVAPGQMYDFYVDLLAPDIAGVYQDAWELHNGKDLPVGNALLVEIEVSQVTRATDLPVADIYFAARPEWLERVGMPAVISWVTHTARRVYFYTYGQDWQNHPVEPSGSAMVFPSSTTNYYLRVVKWDDSVETRKLIVYLEPYQPPVIVSFVLHPHARMHLGECVDITWEVRGGRSTIITILRDGEVITLGLPLIGSLSNCPRYTGDIVYTLYAKGPGGEDTAERTLNVH